jgi:hypothetical protein
LVKRNSGKSLYVPLINAPGTIAPLMLALSSLTLSSLYLIRHGNAMGVEAEFIRIIKPIKEGVY